MSFKLVAPIAALIGFSLASVACGSAAPDGQEDVAVSEDQLSNGILCGIPLKPTFNDDHKVDRARLDPPLFAGTQWVCKLTSNGPMCQTVGPFADDQNTDGQILPNYDNPGPCGANGDKQVYGKVKLTKNAQRFYNKDYKVVRRELAVWGTRDLTLTPDGSGKSIHETRDFCQSQTYSTPADDVSSKFTVTGIELYQSSSFRTVNVGAGQIVRQGDTSHIVSGRWDFDTDFDAAAHRFCSALGAPIP